MSYGKYVAKAPIEFNGVMAFYPGDPVPEDSVKEHGWGDLVEEVKADEPADDSGETGGQSTPPEEPGSPAGKAAEPAKKASSRGASSRS